MLFLVQVQHTSGLLTNVRISSKFFVAGVHLGDAVQRRELLGVLESATCDGHYLQRYREMRVFGLPKLNKFLEFPALLFSACLFMVSKFNIATEKRASDWDAKNYMQIVSALSSIKLLVTRREEADGKKYYI